MALPQTVIYFTINDWLKDWIGYSHMTNLNKPRNKSQWFYLYDLVPPLVGGASRVFAVTAISPLELIRTKMQSIRMVPSEIFTLVAKSIKQDGPQSLWRGVGPTLLRDIPYSMLFWMIYDYSKSVYLRDKYYENRLSLNNTTTDQLSFSKAFTFGAMSGLIAGVLTHPFDVIKTHRQVELGNSLSGDTYPKSTWKSLRLLYASSGLSSLFTGFTPRLLKTTCASAIMIGTFESFKYNFSRLDQPITEPVLNDDNGS